MSDLVDFEDLAQLDGPDLRAVFGQVSDLDVLDALAGTGLGVRRMILTKLPAASAERLAAEVERLRASTAVAARRLKLLGDMA